jgi:hypothetical protein
MKFTRPIQQNTVRIRVGLLVWFVLILTLPSVAKDTKAAKIPEGETHFTAEQLEDYYHLYQNADLKYLRILFDAYLDRSGGTAQERGVLDKWSKNYYRSKFTLMLREGKPFGGTLIHILFVDHPDKVFIALVYPEGEARNLTLKGFSPADFSDRH